jgi:ABC-type branched-subunit amino acid transport system permease subunit
MLAPLYGQLQANNFSILLVAAIAAAVIGGLSSLPLTLIGGFVLGVGQQVLAGYLPLNSVLATGLRPSFPFIVLVAVLLFSPALKRGNATSDPLATCDPPPPALAATLRDASLDRMTKIAFPLFVAASVFVAIYVLNSHYLVLLTAGLIYSTIFLSITLLTGMSGQISLCQATFAGAGAFAAGQLATHQGLSFFAAMLIGGLVAAALGALIAIPALRLGGLYLALATLAFALMADNFLFPLSWIGGGEQGVPVPRPVLGPISFANNHAFFLLALFVLTVCSFVVILIRKGTTGRYLAALRGSETAAASIGINARRAKITVFALSAGIAGVGGAMLGSLNTRTDGTDWVFLYSLVFIVLVLTTGSRTVEGAINAGIGFVLVPELLSHLGPQFVVLTFAGFGFGALRYAQHPEGVLEYQKRKSMAKVVMRQEKIRAWRARRKGLALPPAALAGAGGGEIEVSLPPSGAAILQPDAPGRAPSERDGPVAQAEAQAGTPMEP